MSLKDREGDRHFHPDILLRQQVIRQGQLVLPLAVDDKLDHLVEITLAEGRVKTFRKEVIAALIASVPPDGEEIAAMLGRYRAQTVGELMATLVEPSDSPEQV